jgi:hypothetical protein
MVAAAAVMVVAAAVKVVRHLSNPISGC